MFVWRGTAMEEDPDVSRVATVDSLLSALAVYPDADAPDLPVQIAHRKEFWDFRFLPEDVVEEAGAGANIGAGGRGKGEEEEEGVEVGEAPRPPRGSLLKQQVMLSRFISGYTDYPAMLVVHGVGAGKTCTASAVVEAFRSVVSERGTQPRHALVVVKNAPLRDQIQKDIAEVCTAGQYLPSAMGAYGEPVDARTWVRRLHTAIARSYDVVTYHTLASDLKSKSEALIRAKYSNRVLIFDEAHFLQEHAGASGARSDEEEEEEETSEETSEDEEETDEEDEETDEETDEDEDEEEEEEVVPRPRRRRRKRQTELGRTYDLVWDMLHTVVGSKVLLLTATPIWDRTEEIASLMNLILPGPRGSPSQLYVGRSFYDRYFTAAGALTEEGEEALKAAFRSRVSYLRSLVPRTIQVDQGPQPPTPWMQHIAISPHSMTGRQLDVYQELLANREREREEGEEGRGGATGALRQEEKEAASFVFTDGTYGISGMQAHTGPGGVGGRAGRSRRTGHGSRLRRGKGLPGTFDELEGCSSKMYAALEDIRACKNCLTFVYTELVRGSGAKLFGELLRLYLGYQPYIPGTAAPVAPGARRYAIVTADEDTVSTAAEVRQLLQIFNSPDNREGDRVHVIIGSSRIAEGITLKNVQRVHLLTPHWNMSALDQAVGRAIRYGSHRDLPAAQRRVAVFRHAAVRPGGVRDDARGDVAADRETWEEAWARLQRDQGTVDTSMYHIAEGKDFRNAQVYRHMIVSSFDCILTKAVNQAAPRIGDRTMHGSRACQYQACMYACDGEPVGPAEQLKQPGVIDRWEEVEATAAQIVAVLGDPARDAEEGINLENHLRDADPVLVFAALNALVLQNTPIRSADGTLKTLTFDPEGEEDPTQGTYTLAEWEVDTSTWMLHYSEESIQATKADIKVLFHGADQWALSLASVTALLGARANQEVVQAALGELIATRDVIINAYGWPCYMAYDRGRDVYFTVRDITSDAYPSATESMYNRRPFIAARVSLADYVAETAMERDEALMPPFVQAPSLDRFNAFSFRTQVRLLEDAWAVRAQGKLSSMPEEARRVYGTILASPLATAIAPLDERCDDDAEAEEEGAGASSREEQKQKKKRRGGKEKEKGRGKGRKRRRRAKGGEEGDEVEECEEGVAIHTLLDREYPASAWYAGKRASGLLRMYDPGDGVWITVVDPQRELALRRRLDAHKEAVRRAREARHPIYLSRNFKGVASIVRPGLSGFECKTAMVEPILKVYRELSREEGSSIATAPWPPLPTGRSVSKASSAGDLAQAIRAQLEFRAKGSTKAYQALNPEDVIAFLKPGEPEGARKPAKSSSRAIPTVSDILRLSGNDQELLWWFYVLITVTKAELCTALESWMEDNRRVYWDLV